MMLKRKNGYSVRKVPIPRLIFNDYNAVASSFHRVMGLVEIDITKARERIREIKEKEDYDVSFTAWIAKCTATAVEENKELNSYIKGRKIITFDDIDISIIVEIETKTGKKIPFNYVLRDVAHKSVKDLTDEIRSVQQKKLDEHEQVSREGRTKYTPLYGIIPAFIRRFVIRRILKNPFSLKKLIGTVGITSLGLFAQNVGGWAIPFADKTLNISIGAIKKRVIIKEDKPVEREFLCLTYLFDHNIIDGAPAARFVSRMADLLQNAEYLDDIRKK